MKQFIKKVAEIIDLKLLPLIFGAFLITPIALVNANYMNGSRRGNIPLPLWLAISTGILTLGIAVFYIVKHLLKKRERMLLIALTIVFVLTLSNIITTFLQPETIVSHVLVKSHLFPNFGQYIDVYTEITVEMKVIYTLQFTIILAYIVVGLFVLPCYVKKFDFAKYLSIALFLFFIFTIIFSLITEINKYGNYISQIISLDFDSYSLSQNAIFSIFNHRNVYAMFLMMVTLLMLFNFGLTKKRIYIVFALVPFAYMFFTFSKTSIIITLLALIIYFYSYNVYQFVRNKSNKKLIVIFSVFLFIVVILSIVLGLTVDPIRKILVNAFDDFGTIGARKNIWDTVIELLTPYYFVTGRGYGIVTTLLSDIGHVALGEVVAHEHSWFFSLLSKGGVLLIAGYIVLLCYSIRLFIKSFKSNYHVTLPIALGVGVFFVHSFIENSYYMLFVFIAMLVVFVDISNRKEEVL